MKDLIRIENAGIRYYTESQETFDRGEFYLSVTNILSCVVAQKLQDYMKKNTAGAQQKRLDTTADIGQRIHSLVEQDLQGKEVVPEYDTAKAYDQWTVLKNDHCIQASHTEQFVYHSSGFAGTADIIGCFDGKPCIMDIKTGWYGVKAGWQLAAYRMAWHEMTGENLGMVGIQIKRDGSCGKPFVYEHLDFCETAFKAAFTAYKALNFTALQKMKFSQLLAPTSIVIEPRSNLEFVHDEDCHPDSERIRGER